MGTMWPNTLKENSVSSKSRHPNVVLYLRLYHAPEPDVRIFIISEFIENGRCDIHFLL